jgi:hypothetical protein
MKKILIVMMIVFLWTLSACDKNNDGDDEIIFELYDNNKTYQIDTSLSPNNLSVNDKSEVISLTSTMINHLASHPLICWDNESLFSTDMPIDRNDLDFVGKQGSRQDFTNGTILYTLMILLEDVLNDIDEISDYEEDVFIIEEVEGLHGIMVKDKIYKTYINDNDLYLESYQVDGNRVLCELIELSLENELLSFTWYRTIYDMTTDEWTYVNQISYTNDQLFNINEMTFKDHHIGSYSISKNDLLNQEYLYVFTDKYISKYDDFDQKIRYYDHEKNLEYYLSKEDGDVKTITYSQFNESGQFLYEISKGTSLSFKYNLMMMNGWDKIDNVDGTNQLFFENEILNLPDGVILDIDQYHGIFLTEGIYIKNEEEAFNLELSQLDPPISYQEMLIKNEQITEDATTIINETINQYENDIVDDSISYLNVFNKDVVFVLVADHYRL